MITSAQANSGRILLAYHAEGYLSLCQSLQQMSEVQQHHQATNKEFTPMIAPWPFAQWKLNIMGLFLTVARKLKLLVVDIDYFTK